MCLENWLEERILHCLEFLVNEEENLLELLMETVVVLVAQCEVGPLE